VLCIWYVKTKVNPTTQTFLAYLYCKNEKNQNSIKQVQTFFVEIWHKEIFTTKALRFPFIFISFMLSVTISENPCHQYVWADDCMAGWTADDCATPDCGDGACYINEGRGLCNGSSGIPECVCNIADVWYLTLSFNNKKICCYKQLINELSHVILTTNCK